MGDYSTVPTHIKCAIDSLLHAHALANMHAVSRRKETAQSALDWFATIEASIQSARSELEELTKNA
jgi:hypothetical protein